MAIYKSYWAVKELPPNGKKTTWAARMIDITAVESFQYADKMATKVIMGSGDEFYIRCSYDDFETLVCGFNDGYGKLFTFNNN
ncbi:MAG: hypothetical protein WBA57_04110 [Elainellaceae cyanobacterium]